MQYRIEYSGGRYPEYFQNREKLVERLKHEKNSDVADIRKIYSTGVSDSVLEKYTEYISR